VASIHPAHDRFAERLYRGERLEGLPKLLYRYRRDRCCTGRELVRFARVVALDVAHHITQRGNSRRFILETDTERGVYLDLLQQGIQRHGVELIGYCLMSNHVHLVAVPQSKDALARSLKQTHGRFASYRNAVNRSSGHVWQGRYYSCPLDDTHLWEALRYTELNPVRAFLVTSAKDWPWSSAAAHCGTEDAGRKMRDGRNNPVPHLPPISRSPDIGGKTEAARRLKSSEQHG
jgi:REP element-mobilizing transposase RayT